MKTYKSFPLDRGYVRTSNFSLFPIWLVAIAVIAGSMATAATPAEKPGDADLLSKVPSSLRVDPEGKAIDPSEMSKLKNGGVLSALIDIPDNPVKKGVAVGIVDATPGKVFATIGDYEHFKDFMPYVTKTVVDSQEAYSETGRPSLSKAKVSYWLEFPLNIGNRNYQLELVDGPKLVDGLPVYASEWTYTKVGNLVDTSGSWMIAPWGDGSKSLVRYTVFTDPGGSFPTWVKNMAASSAIPKVIAAVKKRVASKDAAKAAADQPVLAAP